VILRPFEYAECRSLDEAIAALGQGGDDARLIAGGTALVPLMKHGVIRPARLVGIGRVRGLADIAPADGGCRIGALASHRDLARSPLVQERAPLLARACGRVASPAIRSMGTLGGNLCYGESASDPAPALLALRARVGLRGPDGERTVPIEEFFTGFYETALGPAEILTHVEVPPLPAGARWTYLKWTPRAHEDKALVGLAVALALDGPHCREARLGLGGVDRSPVVLARTEAALRGRDLDEAAIARAAETAAQEVEPVDDLQGSAEYRRDMVRVWVRRVVTDLVRAQDAGAAGRRGAGAPPPEATSSGAAGRRGAGAPPPEATS
jgi:carbon-monoxide dehydrogenase medium subunit